MLQRIFTAEFWAVLAGCWSVLSTYAAYRLRRWLTAHLENERRLDTERSARELERHNETLRILSQASASTEPPTLDSLLANEKQDFVLESSGPLSEPPVLDWSDDDDPTTPGTPRALQSEVEMAKKTKPKPRPKY